MSQKPETLFRQKVQKYFKPFEICNDIKVFWIQELSKVGTPDALICYYGKFLALELKSEEGSLAQLQVYNLMGVSQSKGISVALWPSGFEAFKEDFGSKRIPCEPKFIVYYKNNAKHF